MSTIPANTPESTIISEAETTLGAQPSRPKQPTPTVHHYAAPDADRQRGSEYAEVLAYETQQRKNAADRIGRGKHSGGHHGEPDRGDSFHKPHPKKHPGNGQPLNRRLEYDCGLEDTRRALAESITNRANDLTEILRAIHAHPETAYRERFASSTLVEAVRTAYPNLTVTYPAFGIDTAFAVELTSADYDPAKHRTIAILSEYDALPGIGHGCGHNVIATAGLGAFLALADALAATPNAFSGRVLYYGTPAEESDAGKELMARAGAFDTVDAAIMVHPYFMDVADQAWLGRRECRVTYTGVSAHASSHPFMGRNALDAASLAYQGLGLLRQQIPGSDRIHAIIDRGGVARCRTHGWGICRGDVG